MKTALELARGNRSAALMGAAMRQLQAGDEFAVVYKYSALHMAATREAFDDAWGDHEARAILAQVIAFRLRDLVGPAGRAEMQYLESRAAKYIAERLASGRAIHPSIVELWNHLDVNSIWTRQCHEAAT